MVDLEGRRSLSVGMLLYIKFTVLLSLLLRTGVACGVWDYATWAFVWKGKNVLLLGTLGRTYIDRVC